MSAPTKSLYERLGGYDAISAVANDLLPRLQADPQIGVLGAVARMASLVALSGC
ncbi:MAG: hypothetical protein U0894_00715 [Pirellulales bacterium]